MGAFFLLSGEEEFAAVEEEGLTADASSSLEAPVGKGRGIGAPKKWSQTFLGIPEEVNRSQIR